MKHNIYIYISLLVFFLSCGNTSNKTNSTITVFHAGSLALPLKAIADEFQKENTNITINLESSGSVDAARKITDLGKKCNLIAVADYLVIDNMLIPKYANWNYIFASNEMVIAFNDKSRYCKEINKDNWHNILLKEDVIIGRSDPNADPCGYRAIFVFQLAEKIFKIDKLTDKLLSKSNTVIRPKEVDLVAFLETNNIDYLIIYKSVALQHKFKFIELDDKINLSNSDNEHIYNTVSTSIKGTEPDTYKKIKGSTILYSFSIPIDSDDKELATKFANFIIDKQSGKGATILENYGFKTTNLCNKQYIDNIPKTLKNKLYE